MLLVQLTNACSGDYANYQVVYKNFARPNSDLDQAGMAVSRDTGAHAFSTLNVSSGRNFTSV